MFDSQVVFSWPAIILGALVFGFLFEMIFVLADYVLDPTAGLSASSVVFGVIAGLCYVMAGAVVRWQANKKRTPEN